MSVKFFEALAGCRVYPLTDREISGLSHSEQILKLAEAGATLIQLREKTLTPIDFYNEAAKAVMTAREHRIKLIINDRVDIAFALKAGGVHLGQDDLPAAVARRLLGEDAIIGISTHNLEQARVAATLPVDYVAIGPIFVTATKRSSNIPVGLDGLQLVREALGSLPLVAIGGITSENSESVLAAGADAISLIQGLWTAPGQPRPIKDLISAA